MPPSHSLLASLEYSHERDRHATSATANATSISTLLTTTATHLQIRSEVSSTLTDLLTDVEASASLSRHLAATSHTAALRSQLTATRRALAESRAVAAAEVERRQRLGDAFWVQLAKLAVHLGELEGWKEDNRGRVEEYDEMRRRLDDMTDRARALEMALEEGQRQEPAEKAAVPPVHKASTEEAGVQIDLASEEPGGRGMATSRRRCWTPPETTRQSRRRLLLLRLMLRWPTAQTRWSMSWPMERLLAVPMMPQQPR